MIISDYLARLRARDIILTTRDGRLRVDAPAGALTVDDRDTLGQWKDEIVLYLDRVTRTAPVPVAETLLSPATPTPEGRRQGESSTPEVRHGWGTITLLWPATSKVPCPRGKWRRLEGGDIEVTFTRQELRDALALAGVDVLALERGAEVADSGR